MNFKLRLVVALAGVLTAAAVGTYALGHCQIPCGIFDDPMRLKELEEDVTTIEKSMKGITSLSREQPPNWNQIVRWVNNKDLHADKLSEIVTYYFMAQRIKPADASDKQAYSKYVQQITLLHQILVHAMKAKQTTDLGECDELRDLIGQFRASYLGEKAAGHSHAVPAPSR